MSKTRNIQKDKSGKTVSSPKRDSQKPASVIQEYNFKIVAIIGFFVSLLLLIFSYHFFGSYFEMNDDPRYVMAMKGFASPVPYNNFVSVYKFTSDLYIWLYKNFPDIGWYGYSMFFIMLGSLFNIFISIYLVALNRINFLFIILIFIGFYFLIYFQNVYWINFTRPSIIGTSSFILLLGALYLNQYVLIKNKWIIIFPVITYIIAHFTRLDGGYLGFIFGITASLLIVSVHKNIFPFLLKYILPVFIFILMIKLFDIFSQKNNPGNSDFLEKTEIIRQLIDYRNAAEYRPTSIKDTLAYNAMINARYCSDDKVISKEYLKKLTNKSPLLVSGNKKKMETELTVFYDSLKEENSIARNINYSFFIILMVWFFISGKDNLSKILKYILLQLFFIGLITGMSYYMKLPARIFNPLLVMLTISNILFLFSIVSFKEKKYYYLVSIIFISALFALPQYTKANKANISNYKKYGRVNQGMFNDMNQFQNTIFIPTSVRSWEMHNATDPIREINFENGNCYVYLSIELSLAPETKDQLIDKFGTSDHAKLFNNICKMNNVVFISTNDYNNFLRGYYHYLYNQDYYFEKVRNENAPFYENTGLDYYRLKKN